MSGPEHGVGSVPRDAGTVGRLIERTAARLPNKLALTSSDRRWTYTEFARAVSRIASRLLAMGLAPGDQVAAFGRNSDAYILLFSGLCPSWAGARSRQLQRRAR